MIAWGIDHHGDDKVSSDLCSLSGSIRPRLESPKAKRLKCGATGRKNGTTVAELDSLGHEILRYDSLFLWQAINPLRRAAEKTGLLGGWRPHCHHLEPCPKHCKCRRQLDNGEVHS